jgi:diacylglycerol kinase (ATP)
MSDKRLFAIVNPAAGGGRCGTRADAALGRLRASGLDVEAVRTTRAGEAVTLARDAFARGERRFLAVGGDGTSHEIVNGIAALAKEKGERPTLAMLPLGTGNSFLRDFDVLDAESAIRAIVRGAEHPCDLLALSHEAGSLFSINIVGLGFSAAVGALTNRSYKPLGAAGYVVAVVQTTVSLETPSYPLRVDGGALDSREAILLSFCNSRCTAGAMQMAPRADVGDGELDVIRIGAMPRRRFLAQFPSIFRGTHVEKPGVEQSRARRVDFTIGRPVDCMVDGEILSLEPRSLEVVPHALTVIA